MKNQNCIVGHSALINNDKIVKQIAVIFGGCSSEYNISLQSAYSVISTLKSTKFTYILIGISKQGDWFRFTGSIDKIVSDTWCNSSDCTPILISPNRNNENSIFLLEQNKLVSVHIDAVFPILHGKNGEDGTVQGLFELAGIPIVGCGLLSSALCMDKDRSHKLVCAAGIAIPISFVFQKNMHWTTIITKVEQIGYPLFVKPVKSGSSYGITKVNTPNELSAAIELAFKYDEKIIIEECISGFEVGCAILGNDTLIIGELDEIELQNGFFNFTEKYSLLSSQIHVPARVSEEISTKIKDTAQIIYHTLDCHGFARIDMFLSSSNEIIFNEVNTIPGFTPHSRFPNMMKAIGMSFGEIISHVIELAVSH